MGSYLPSLIQSKFFMASQGNSWLTSARSPEFGHDCSALWHTSGQYFFVATRTHGECPSGICKSLRANPMPRCEEIVTISRNDWVKSSTLSDDACSGAITALALSKNGMYLAAAFKSGIFIWATQNRRMLFRYEAERVRFIMQI